MEAEKFIKMADYKMLFCPWQEDITAGQLLREAIVHIQLLIEENKTLKEKFNAASGDLMGPI